MGWLGSILLLISVWLVGSKNRTCFMFGFLGNFIWIMVGIEKGMSDLVFINAVFVIFNIRAWFKWGEENKYWNSLFLPKYRVRWWQVWK